MADWLNGGIQSQSRRESGSGQNLTAESQKLIAWLHRADRSGPSDIDGNQTSGVVIHSEWLFGGDYVSLIFRISMCYTLIRCGELEGAHKVPRIRT